MNLAKTDSWEEIDVQDCEDSLELKCDDEVGFVKSETTANLQYCSKVLVGNKLEGPIKVEKMVVHGGPSQNTKRAFVDDDVCEDVEFYNIEYNVGSIMQVFDEESVKFLRESFKKNPRPDKVERDRLADLTGTRRKFVRKWFEIERSKRKREMTWREPINALNIMWTSWPKKYRRKVLFVGSLFLIYALLSCYCICFLTWNELLITNGISFVLINSILTFLQ